MQYFEDLVIGHFRDRASGILRTCRDYYTKGVGDKCGIVVIKETRSSRKYKTEVKGYMKILIGAFKQIGVEEQLENFVPPTENLTIQLPKAKKKKNLTHKILSCFCI